MGKRHTVRMFAVLYRAKGRKAWTTLNAHFLHSAAINEMEWNRKLDPEREYTVVPATTWITKHHLAAPPIDPRKP